MTARALVCRNLCVTPTQLFNLSQSRTNTMPDINSLETNSDGFLAEHAKRLSALQTEMDAVFTRLERINSRIFGPYSGQVTGEKCDAPETQCMGLKAEVTIFHNRICTRLEEINGEINRLEGI